MRETDKQTIERLEKVIAEQKAELTEVKKDRKRLNYAVERLEREKTKLSLQSSKEDTKVIKELERLTQSNQSEIENLIRQNKELKEMNEGLVQFRKETEERTKQNRSDDKERLWRWENFLSGFERDKWGQLFFDIDTLITKINPLNGDYPTFEQQMEIEKTLNENPEYKEIKERIEPLKPKIKEEDYGATMQFYSECKKLMESYVSVFFGQ